MKLNRPVNDFNQATHALSRLNEDKINFYGTKNEASTMDYKFKVLNALNDDHFHQANNALSGRHLRDHLCQELYLYEQKES